MSDNPLDEMAKISATDSAPLGRRVEDERKVQDRSRFVRRTCRWTMSVLFVAAFAAIAAGRASTIPWISQSGYALFIPIGICAVVLFFMGGLNTGKTRAVLSERNRRLIDD